MQLLPTGPKMTGIMSGPQWGLGVTSIELRWPKRVLLPCSFHSALPDAAREAAALLSAIT